MNFVSHTPMYNTDMPQRADLPSSAQLLRSTVIAVVSALVLLLTVVLPAEYAVDPTGLGRALGLTQMGEIKAGLVQQAVEESVAPPASQNASDAASATPPVEVDSTVASAAAVNMASNATVWRDEISFPLTPGQGTEIKMKMKAGEKALYAWSVQDGVVNFDAHGDGQGRSISYEKGRAVASDEGELVAAFTGNHGWYFRNRGAADVTLVLRTGGAYSDIQRTK